MSLVEVSVVAVLVLSIFALAVPTFGGNASGEDNAARSVLSAAMDAQLALRDQTGEFSSDLTALDDLVPRVSHTAAASTGPKSVSVLASTIVIDGEQRDMAAVAVLSDSGSCWLGQVSVSERAALYAVDPDPGVCNATAAASLVPNPAKPGVGASPTNPLEL